MISTDDIVGPLHAEGHPCEVALEIQLAGLEY